jgi:hypothetical protein
MEMNMDRVQSLTTDEKRNLDLSDRIQGWGADLNPNVRPGVPRDKAPNIGVESLYINAEQQIPRFKIHRSTEHMRLTPVFGTSCPPTGLSGMIRDFAYQYSEGQMRHWLMLMFADRVNMIEGIVQDIAEGHIPNVWQEMGLSAELKYNKKNFLIKTGVVAAGVVGLLALLRSRKSPRPRRISMTEELA